MKKKLLTLATGLVVAVTMMFGGTASVFADGPVSATKVDVKITVQDGNSFAAINEEFRDVSSDLAETWGYTDAVPAGQVSALDALVQLHIGKYESELPTIDPDADEFEAAKTKLKEYLAMNDYGSPSTMLGKTKSEYTGFTVNDDCPMLDSGYGAAVNSAVLTTGDKVGFFWYDADSDGYDYTTTFTNAAGSRINEVFVGDNIPASIYLTGFSIMDSWTTHSYGPIAGAAIGKVDALTGKVSSLRTDPRDFGGGKRVYTDSKGKATVKLEKKSGQSSTEYILTATQGSFDYALVMPLLRVVVLPVREDLTVPNTSFDKAYGNSAFKLGASTSKNDAKYSSSNNKVAAVSSTGTVTIKNTGKAIITVKAPTIISEEVFETSKQVVIKIAPKKAALTKLTKGTKKLTAQWSKDSRATGYQLMTATNSKFTKGKKSVVIKKNSTTKATVKNLKAKKTYYVKVRAYKTIDGKAYYGAWSNAKAVKTK